MPSRSELYTRWGLEMRRSGLFRAGERVGVAVSGGPDSVLLLEFMRHLARELGLVLAVVHFNHHLRGAESDADEQFVHTLARNLGLQFLRAEADVARVAREKRRNLEATARELRYRFFFSLADRGRLDRVVTAHTADDQAETVLLRLLRGTGTRGLSGIYPVLEGKIVRPFLRLTREEIEAEIKARGLVARVDASNLDTRFRRNKVRLELLPVLRREYSPEIVTLLKELANRAREDEEVLEQLARERAHPWRVREGREEKIPVRVLAELPAAIARRVLRQMVLAAQGSLRGITHRHIQALYRLAAHGQSGKSQELPGGIQARKEFDWLIVGPQPARDAAQGFTYPVQVPGKVSVSELGLTLRFEIVSPAKDPKAYNKLEGAGLDPRKLRGELRIRNWRAGDRFRPAGSRSYSKLKELFRQQRIPVDKRRLWPVLENGEEIIWVRGFPAASSVAATPGGKEIVLIREESAEAGSAR